jgi:hypothetical protein
MFQTKKWTIYSWPSLEKDSGGRISDRPAVGELRRCKLKGRRGEWVEDETATTHG